MSGEVRYSFTEGELVVYLPQEIMFQFAEWAGDDFGEFAYWKDVGKWKSTRDIEDKTTEELFQIFKQEKLNK